MKRNKALLPFGDSQSLAHYQFERLKPLFQSCFISCKKPKIFDFDAPFIVDGNDSFAPTSGFISAFESIESERIFVISVDTPFIDSSIIEKIINADSSDIDAVIARTAQGIHPLCGIYHRRLLEKFIVMQQEENHRLGALLKQSLTRFVDFEAEEAFLNLNHPEEYHQALNRLKD